VTKLEGGVNLLHDPWGFEEDLAKAKPFRPFDIAADLHLTGYWAQDARGCKDQIRRRLLEHVLGDLSYSHDPIAFARSHRFHPQYRTWLSSQLGIRIFEPNPQDPQTQYGNELVLYGSVKTPPPQLGRRTSRVCQFPDDTVFARAPSGQIAVDLKNALASPFPTNPKNSIAVFRIHLPRGTLVLTRVFVKEVANHARSAETEGASSAAAFFPLVQKQVVEGSSLLYPYFDGTTEAEAQLEYHNSGQASIFVSVLDCEMRKAEDTLNAYKASLQPCPRARKGLQAGGSIDSSMTY
jgi:hypothetical protein